jgi:ribosomal protein S18 acetylase RimI-like enzyme
VIEIAPAIDSDREWAAHLMAASEPWVTLGRGLEACRAACRRPELLMFVAREDGAPTGFVLANPRGVAGAPYIASIAVSEAARGRGIGARLLDHAAQHFRAEARHLFLCVSSFNAGARRFYERLGWKAVGELEEFVIEGASEILMHLRLRR